MHMHWGFFIKNLLETAFLSPLLSFLMIICGLLLINRAYHRGLVIAWCGVLLAVFFSTPITVNWLAKRLECYPSLQTGQLTNAQAIVILGGGAHSWAQEYGGAMPSRITLERLRYGARLARQTALPVLVSGGALPGREPEAKIMAESLKTDFSITAQWMEGQSLDTAGNARYSAEILKDAGIKRVVLVTTAAHMRRAVNEFRHTGLEIIPAPTAFFSDEPPIKELYEYFPSIASGSVGSAVVHEWVGILVQHIRGSLAL